MIKIYSVHIHEDEGTINIDTKDSVNAIGIERIGNK